MKAIAIARRHALASQRAGLAHPFSSTFYSPFSTENNSTTSYHIPLRLNTIKDNEGAFRPRKRVGRGEGSGRGKTAGRGQKGQKSRTGGGIPYVGFEGGATPFYKRIPKRGFTNKFARPMEALNLEKLQDWIEQGRIDTTRTITIKDIVDSGMITRMKHGVKLLGRGADSFTAKVDIEVSQASQSAIEAVEKSGGKIKTVYHNRLALRALLKPHKFEGRPLPRRAKPTPKLMPYYTNYKNRGEFSAEMQLKNIQNES
jgi:large subunit ribosomal protein L15